MQSLLSGCTFDETVERVQKAVPISFFNAIKLWPAASAISFLYVPLQLRSIFVGVIAIGWQTYLSWLNQNAAREVKAEEADGLTGVQGQLIRA